MTLIYDLLAVFDFVCTVQVERADVDCEQGVKHNSFVILPSSLALDSKEHLPIDSNHYEVHHTHEIAENPHSVYFLNTFVLLKVDVLFECVHFENLKVGPEKHHDWNHSNPH